MTKREIIAAIVMVVVLMLIATCWGIKEHTEQTSTPPNDTTKVVTNKHSEVITFDTAAYLKHIIPIILKQHLVKSQYSPGSRSLHNGMATSGQHGQAELTGVSSTCDSLNTYIDTLEKCGVMVISTIMTRGDLISHTAQGTVKEKVITKTVTDSDSTLTTRTIKPHELSKKEKRKAWFAEKKHEIKLFGDGVLAGISLGVAAIELYAHKL